MIWLLHLCPLQDPIVKFFLAVTSLVWLSIVVILYFEPPDLKLYMNVTCKIAYVRFHVLVSQVIDSSPWRGGFNRTATRSCPTSISIDVMERTASLQPTLTLTYVGDHSVLDSNCKSVQISPLSNCGCESMLLVGAVFNGVSKVIRKLLWFWFNYSLRLAE